MARVLHLGRWFGIPVRVHWSFALLLVWVVWREVSAGSSVGQIAAWVGLTLTVFTCVVLHEYGHALTARRFGVGTQDITLLPIGGVARLKGMPERPIEEFLVAVAGPAVNVVIAVVVGGAALAVGWLRVLDPDAIATGPGFVSSVVFVNAFLVVFNMLPAFPMDGGRVVRALLATRMGFLPATVVAARIGQVTAVGLGLLGVFGSPVLILIAVFVFFGAQAELRSARTREQFRGVPVAAAMLRPFLALSPSALVHEAAAQVLAGRQAIIPVLDADGGPVGIVRPAAVVAALKAGHGSASIVTILDPDPVQVSPDEPLLEAAKRIDAAGASGASGAVVVAAGRVVGVLAPGGPRTRG